MVSTPTGGVSGAFCTRKPPPYTPSSRTHRHSCWNRSAGWRSTRRTGWLGCTGWRLHRGARAHAGCYRGNRTSATRGISIRSSRATVEHVSCKIACRRCKWAVSPSAGGQPCLERGAGVQVLKVGAGIRWSTGGLESACSPHQLQIWRMRLKRLPSQLHCYAARRHPHPRCSSCNRGWEERGEEA